LKTVISFDLSADCCTVSSQYRHSFSYLKMLGRWSLPHGVYVNCECNVSMKWLQ